MSLIHVKDDTKSDADTNTNTRNIIEIPWWQSLGEPCPSEGLGRPPNKFPSPPLATLASPDLEKIILFFCIYSKVSDLPSHLNRRKSSFNFLKENPLLLWLAAHLNSTVVADGCFEISWDEMDDSNFSMLICSFFQRKVKVNSKSESDSSGSSGRWLFSDLLRWNGW